MLEVFTDDPAATSASVTASSSPGVLSSGKAKQTKQALQRSLQVCVADCECLKMQMNVFVCFLVAGLLSAALSDQLIGHCKAAVFSASPVVQNTAA